jgi:hypothetical protein
MTDYTRWRAEQMRDWRFRFWYTVWWPWYQMARLRMWLWRVTHRREARRLDEYVGER